MKISAKILAMMAMAMLAFSFTSCDDDDEIARTLEGTWEGNMYVSTYWNDRYYDASYTMVHFERDPYTYSSGDGYWVDYYNGNYWDGYNYWASYITWTVNFGTITIRFDDGDTVDIYKYSLNDDYFTGYIRWRDGPEERFSLRHISSPNWGNYYFHNNYSNVTSMQDDEGVDATKIVAPKTSATDNAPKRVFRMNK